MVEALLQGNDGARAALATDCQDNNALHVAVSERFKDPASALSILKAAPETASRRNEDRVLPIEVCLIALLLLFLQPSAYRCCSRIPANCHTDCVHVDASTGSDSGLGSG